MADHSISIDGDSLIHRLNPLTKLAAIPFVVSLAFVLPVIALWSLSFILILAGWTLGVGGPLSRRYLIFLLPFLVALTAFHGFILPSPGFVTDRGLLSYNPAGLSYAASVGGRISLMLSGSLLFVTTTHPSKLLRALDAAQCPPALSFLLASPLLLIGEFTARATAISHAQQARGMRVDNPLSRLRAVTVLIVPLITLALADASERSQVLTARGFRALPRRTVLVAPADSILERRLRFLFLAATAALSGYALWR